MADAETPTTQNAARDSGQTAQEVPGTEYAEEKGIDVSHYQEDIDWSKVAKAGVKHAYIKMSEGASLVDKKFAENWKGASDAKIKVNCYHYFRALDPIDQQFQNIKKNTQAVKFDPEKNSLAIDVEEKGNEKATPLQVAENLKALLGKIKQDAVLSRKSPVIYTSFRYWDYKVKYEGCNFDTYPLWVVQYTANAPKLPAPWRNAGKNWVWWQYSDSGDVDGIKTKVDLNKVKV